MNSEIYAYLCKTGIQNLSNIAEESMGVLPKLTKLQPKSLKITEENSNYSGTKAYSTVSDRVK